MNAIRWVALLIVAIFSTSAAQAVTIEMVRVGNPGNASDTRHYATGIGSVGWNYWIGKYEVTAGQYSEFLNAVAKDDPNGLYNTAMGDPVDRLGANIQRNGSPGNYSYSVELDWADRPINYVSFWDATRFANWLHNGQPSGPQDHGTTEDGAYVNIGNQATFARQPGARFVIPTEDEWYKAAYHDKSAGLAASYFDYPTGTNSVPGNDVTETTNPGNNASFFTTNFAIGAPYYRTAVGHFSLSDSPYGTFDQGGNVWEWNETAVTGSSRGSRGGNFDGFSDYLAASFRWDDIPAFGHYLVGFRVASVIPEPGSVTMCLAGVVMLIWRRDRR